MSLQLTPPTRTHTRIHHLFDNRVAQAPAHPFLYLTQGVMTLGQLAQQVDLLEAELRSRYVEQAPELAANTGPDAAFADDGSDDVAG